MQNLIIIFYIFMSIMSNTCIIICIQYVHYFLRTFLMAALISDFYVCFSGLLTCLGYQMVKFFHGRLNNRFSYNHVIPPIKKLIDFENRTSCFPENRKNQTSFVDSLTTKGLILTVTDCPAFMSLYLLNLLAL